MKKTKLIPYGVITLLVLVLAIGVQAQQSLQLKIGYNVASPVGDFRDVVNKTSFRGFTGELAYPISDRLQVGVNVLYNDFYQKFPRAVYNTTEGTVSAVITNSVQTLPLLAKVNYNITKQGLIRPYAGLGAGFNLITYKQYLGEFSNGKNAFKPAVTGDAGVNIAVGRTKTAGVNLGANFNYLPFNYSDISTLSNWGVHAGIFFTLH